MKRDDKGKTNEGFVFIVMNSLEGSEFGNCFAYCVKTTGWLQILF